MQAARAFAPPSGIGSLPAATALACGYLLLTGFLLGAAFKRIGLPKLTGYLFAGIVTGPNVLGLVSHEQVANLQIFNGVAIALIALTAGSEMHFRSLRPIMRTIGWVSLIAVTGTSLLLWLAAWLLRDMLPFLSAGSELQVVAVCAVLGVVMGAKSPAVVVALRDETDADGPMVRTVLSSVVLSDLVVILLFALVSTWARSTFGQSVDAAETASTLAWEILGSAGVGVLVGVLIALYLRFVKGGALFVLAVAFLVAEIGRRLDFDPLLVALSAGIFIRNATNAAQRLLSETESAAFPVYIAFFAVTGAGVHLDALVTLGLPAAILVALRGVGLYFGTDLASRVAKAPEVFRRYGGFGLMPQAGLALALAILFKKNFPDLGEDASALIFGIVALNEMIAPVLFRLALIRSGEAGKLRRGDAPDLDGSQIPDGPPPELQPPEMEPSSFADAPRP
ncbi:MAG: cation:proton antiporter [Deltaproteobacteria bacterium]|nr:cation:proton antiporter [Deltaproteobacteria bacterium]